MPPTGEWRKQRKRWHLDVPEIDSEAIVAAYKAGETGKNLSQRYHCRTTVIAKILADAGIDLQRVSAIRSGYASRGYRASSLKHEYPDFGYIWDVDWAYAAGIFDGEGTIAIYRNSGRYRLSVAQNGTVLGEWFVSRFGGKVALKSEAGEIKEGGYVTTEDHYTWYLSAQLPILAVLEGISPYLVLKKRLADEGIIALRKRYMQ